MLFPNQRSNHRFQILDGGRRPARFTFRSALTHTRYGRIAILLLAAFTFLHQPAFGAAPPSPYAATLAWERSPDNSVTGYRVYFGRQPRQYTNSVNAGNLINTTIAGLTAGVPYYFAVTAYDAGGGESDFSNEVQVVPGQPRLRLGFTATRQAVLSVSGLVGHTYDILASPDLTVWTWIGSTTLGPTAAQDFTDPNAAGFPKRFYRLRDTIANQVADATVVIRFTTPLQTMVTVTGLPGHTYELQVSLNLTGWTSLSQVTLDAGGSQNVLDRVTPYLAPRFYRARHLGP